MCHKPALKYVSTDFGCSIRIGPDSQIIREIGTAHIKGIRFATEKDVAWVRGMGGRVPDGRIAKVKEQP
jgi:hypothetical protein